MMMMPMLMIHPWMETHLSGWKRLSNNTTSSSIQSSLRIEDDEGSCDPRSTWVGCQIGMEDKTRVDRFLVRC